MFFRAGKCDPLDTQESIRLRISHPQKHYLPLPFPFTLGLCFGEGKHSVPTLKSLLNVSGEAQIDRIAYLQLLTLKQE